MFHVETGGLERNCCDAETYRFKRGRNELQNYSHLLHHFDSFASNKYRGVSVRSFCVTLWAFLYLFLIVSLSYIDILNVFECIWINF